MAVTRESIAAVAELLGAPRRLSRVPDADSPRRLRFAET